MRRIIPGAIGAFAIAALGFSGAAQAQCWFNGDGVSCAQAASAPNYDVPHYGPMDWDQRGLGYYRGRIAGPHAEFGAASHMGPEPGGGFYHLGVTDRGRTD